MGSSSWVMGMASEGGGVPVMVEVLLLTVTSGVSPFWLVGCGCFVAEKWWNCLGACVGFGSWATSDTCVGICVSLVGSLVSFVKQNLAISETGSLVAPRIWQMVIPGRILNVWAIGDTQLAQC